MNLDLLDRFHCILKLQHVAVAAIAVIFGLAGWPELSDASQGVGPGAVIPRIRFQLSEYHPVFSHSSVPVYFFTT